MTTLRGKNARAPRLLTGSLRRSRNHERWRDALCRVRLVAYRPRRSVALHQKANPKATIILASSSPLRKRSLEALGLGPRVIPHRIMEFIPPTGDAGSVARHLARLKAIDVRKRVRGGLILAADTLVSRGSNIFGSPRDARHARRMLRELSGSLQSVVTGVCLMDAATGRFRTATEVTILRFAKLSKEDIDCYIRSGEWRGKAGAYAINEDGDPWVSLIKGNLDNACGFPASAFRRLYRGFQREVFFLAGKPKEEKHVQRKICSVNPASHVNDAGVAFFALLHERNR